MEKLTTVSNFTKSVDLLRNQECSQKEKIANFHQIADCILSPSLRLNAHFIKHVSSAISLLLLFCEDLDSVTRMSAEENLNKVLRSLENDKFSRILLDLYSEIKRNGNQKSLRICLNIFAYYSHRIKEKNVKWYALRLVPCLQIIAHRKETLLVESLSEFMKSFSKNLQICINDNETYKLMETFLMDIQAECPVKRRCSAQNCMTIIEHSRNKKLMARHGLNKSIEFISNHHHNTNVVLGVLGFLRLLMPMMVSETICDCKQIVEIFDFCLYLLNNPNHSIINASLEVINSILSRRNRELEEILISQQLKHNEILKKRKSLKNQIFQLKNLGTTCTALGSARDGVVHEDQLRKRTASTSAIEAVRREEPLNKQQPSRKSSTETIKDAFKSDPRNENYEMGMRLKFNELEVSNKFNEISVDALGRKIDGNSSSSSYIDGIQFDIVDKSGSENNSRAACLVKSSLSEINEPQKDVDDYYDDGGHLAVERIMDDKSQNLSDMDNESFKSIDFESEIAIGEHEHQNQQQGDTKRYETLSLRSQKSTDSIGSFFNSLLAHPSTETMTKLFRPSTKLSGTTTDSSTTSTPKTKQQIDEKLASKATTVPLQTPQQQQYHQHHSQHHQHSYPYQPVITNVAGTLTLEDDTISLESINSHISLGSHVSCQSSTQDLVRNEQDLVLVHSNDYENEKISEDLEVQEQESQEVGVASATESKTRLFEMSGSERDAYKEDTSMKDGDYNNSDENNTPITSTRTTTKRMIPPPEDEYMVDDDDDNVDNASIRIDIGSIYEQNIIYYTVRLIASKFLLSGAPNGIFSDTIVRVSIKNLSLNVLASCIKLKPEVLSLHIGIDRTTELCRKSQYDSTMSMFEDNNDNSSNEIGNDFDMGDQIDDYAKDSSPISPTFAQNRKSIQLEQTPLQQQQETEQKEELDEAFDNNLLLEIKDDHFGECTTKFFDFNTPLSKSADQSLINKLKNPGNTFSIDGRKPHLVHQQHHLDKFQQQSQYNPEQNKEQQQKIQKNKLNQQLEQILSKSEIIESKSCLEQTKSTKFDATSSSSGSKVLSPYNQSDSEREDKHQKTSQKLQQQQEKQQQLQQNQPQQQQQQQQQHNKQDHQEQKQYLSDILLFHNHPDPILRGDVQIIIRNFIDEVLFTTPPHNLQQTLAQEHLNINELLRLILKGLRDEIHTVVIQALTSFDKIFSLLMSTHFNVLNKQREVDDDDDDERFMEALLRSQPKEENNKEIGKFSEDIPSKLIISPRVLLNQLRLCYDNKYWLVQNKYADVISNLDFESIQEYYGDDIAKTYEDMFLCQLFGFLGENDSRVREHIAKCICNFILCKTRQGLTSSVPWSNFELVQDYFKCRLSQRIPMPDIFFESVKQGHISIQEMYLSRILYYITNKLLQLDDRNIQFGIIAAIKALMDAFNPIDFNTIWSEFNLMEVCVKYTHQNYPVAIDLNGQNDLLEISTTLLAANTLSGKVNMNYVDILLRHTMKIINVYYHLIANVKPLILPKAQKGDMFINAKELAIINRMGYFVHDEFYLKLLNILKSSYETYKITINESSGIKFISLLTTSLKSLSTLLEFKQTVQPTDTIKHIEEILQYLGVLVNYAPVETICCLKQLLKFLFGRNYANRKHDYDNFINFYMRTRKLNKKPQCLWDDVDDDDNNDGNADYEKGIAGRKGNNNEDHHHDDDDDAENNVRRTTKGEWAEKKKYNNAKDSHNLGKLFASAMNFPLGKSQTEEECAKHIKLFEPLVIYCLTLFMKSNATIQAPILDLLSQLLELNVTYSILDSKNVIFDQVIRNLELIETGVARNSTIIIPSIIKFLFNISKQLDKKLISIPKIISTTNGLLANNTIVECSVLALKELGYEIFFNSHYDLNSSPHGTINAKELNTQKEVILRMLEKFINSLECQKMLSTLLLWSKLHGVGGGVWPDPRDEILAIVTKGMEDGKIEATNGESFCVLESLFKNSEKNLLLDSKRFEIFLSLFMKTSPDNFNKLSQNVIILENVILNTEEIYLINHVKLYLKNNSDIYNSHVDENNYLAKVLYEKLMTCFTTLMAHSRDAEFCFLTRKYVKSLTALENFDGLRSALRIILMQTEFYGKLNSISENMKYLQFEISKLLCKLCCDKNSVLENVLKFNNKKEGSQLIKILFEKFADNNLWTHQELKCALGNDAFLENLKNRAIVSMLASLSANSQFAEILFEEMDKRCNSKKENLINILKFLRVIHQNSNLLKIKFLLKIQSEKKIGRLLLKRIDLHQQEYLKYLSNLNKEELLRICSPAEFQELQEVYIGNVANKLSHTTLNAFELLSKKLNGKKINDEQFEHIKNKSITNQLIDEDWLIEQIIKSSTDCLDHSENIVKILMELKSEIKIQTIFDTKAFSKYNFLKPCINLSFDFMIINFQIECVQYNPHINYMKMHPLLKVCLRTLFNIIKTHNSHHLELKQHIDEGNLMDANLCYIARATIALLENINNLERIGLIYIETKFVEKFIKEQIFNTTSIYESLIDFANICCTNVMLLFKYRFNREKSLEIDVYFKCIDAILKQKFIWLEFNQPEKYKSHLNKILDMLYEGVTKSIGNTILYEKYKIQVNGNDVDDADKNAQIDGSHMGNVRKAIFIAKLIETKSDEDDESRNDSWELIYGASSMKILKSIAVTILRTNYFYALAVTPFELLESFGYDRKPHIGSKLPSIPVEYLSDAEILQKFIKRLSTFGFSTRQQFEEYFMTFLLLINKVYDENMVDFQEQFQIKSTCLAAILELLIICKTFPLVGDRQSQFLHFPRLPKIACDTISTKKLHKVQLIIPSASIFYHPNLERNLSLNFHDNIIGTNYFLTNQYELNYVWRQMEGPSNGGDFKESAPIKNSRYFSEMSGIDLRSSCQLIFDVFTQIIEQNHVLVLPNLVKFCEICDNREQIRWIKDTMNKLQKQIPADDTISHQYIIYLLCRTQSILVPSYTDLVNLCSIISTYLKSSHIFIRNATLHGLLCLLECCYKTNTAIGKLSEELFLVRDLIYGYITRHGIIKESSALFSDAHTKLVWTLNFSLIEMTTKFVPECNLLENTIISANNLLKRTTNESLYLCVVHGLERISVVCHIKNPICDKIEKLALELVKFENERFSLPALKLLMTCVYMGSSKQLENTEHSNGIVQDDPEIIVQQTEKVDVLLQRIKSSTSSAAKIYGEVLCQIIRDLVPPNEILTKVIKEFLTINQPHCEVIARIVYQVFRSAIDSSFLQTLQDWLICSLPNFLVLPIEKSVWSLTVIFLSASINLHLIKLFPFVLNEFKMLNDAEISLFVTSARDFYMKLNLDQKKRFREVFSKSELEVFKQMLLSL